MAGERRESGGMRGLGPLPFLENKRRGKRETLSRDTFRETLLEIMEAKDHWAGSAFSGMVPKEKMVHHFRSEYQVFVRDFPDYLDGAFTQCPIPEVRKDLEENIAEERYGIGAQKILEKLTGTALPQRSHAELFLLIPQGLGFDTSDFETAPLKPKARAYRNFLIKATTRKGWEVAAAVSTLFLEGNKHERSVFATEFPDIEVHAGVQSMEDHPLHIGYGLDTEYLLLPGVHHVFDSADGEHRLNAWNMILNHIPEAKRAKVVAEMQNALKLWHAWRDEVANTCGIEQSADGSPRLKV